MVFIAAANAYARPRLADEETLSVGMSNRLEGMVEKMIGQGRCLAKVSVELYQSQENNPLAGNLRGIPGLAVRQEKPTQEKSQYPGMPEIKSIAVALFLDDKLPPAKVEEVKAAVPKLMELNFSRGDSLKIEQIPWRQMQPEDIAAKQLSSAEKNFRVIIIIAGIFILALIVLLLLLLPANKFIKERSKIKPHEPQKLPDFEKLINDLKDSLAKPESKENSANLAETLENIKEALVNAPSKTDDLLKEIKETLGKIAEKPAFGGGGSSGTGETAGPSLAANAEFIKAMKEAMAPAGGAAAGGATGTAMSPEVLTTLKDIQQLMKQQVDATAMGNKILDEPFKYLNTLTNREISLYIDSETPRLQAIILGHIDANKAGEIISTLADEKKLALSEAMASLVENEDVAAEMKDFIQRKMPQVKMRADFSPIVGNKVLAGILSSMPYNQTTAILDGLEKSNRQLAETVKNEMFLFEHILNVDDKNMQEIIKILDKDRLAMALCRSADQVCQKFFSNMTEKAVTILKEDIESLKPAPAKEGEEPKKITLFEDIVNLDSKTAEKLFKNVDKDTLKIALKATSDEVRDKFYSMMSERSASMLKEDIDVMPTIPADRAEEAHKAILDTLENMEKLPLVAQKEIIEKILELEKAGRVSIRKKA